MRRLLLLAVSVCCSVAATAQQPLAFNKYWIQFNHKNNTPFSISQPAAYLSERAIERRQRYNIAITAADLPVDPAYVSALRNTQASVLYASKWFNGAVVQVSDTSQLIAIAQLPFVVSSQPVSMPKRKKTPATAPRQSGTQALDTHTILSLDKRDTNTVVVSNDSYYGTAFGQIHGLMGDYLHAYGYKGEGMHIGVLDAGFIKVDENPAFAALRQEGRLLGTHDFVDGDSNVYESSEHGANVLSIMAGDIPGTYVGSAPKASYWLLRTEQGNTETMIEEYNWAAGAEFADSVGVDLINSSLGYSTFDNALMNHAYADMNGNTAIASRAADLAAARGIMVVVSAGNLGGSDWYYISAPADADSALTVGAIDSTGLIGYFSSHGPTADGRVKPNVVGQGVMTAYVNINGNTAAGNGTSYSSPLVAGLTACLWQAAPDRNNIALMRQIEQSCDRFESPDGDYGYGMPNFYSAMLTSLGMPTTDPANASRAFAYPNPFNTQLNVYYYAPKSGTVQVDFLDTAGKTIHQQQYDVVATMPYRFTFNDWASYPRGAYLIKVSGMGSTQTLKVVKTE